MDTTVSTLLAKLEEPRVSDANVIRWSSPVPSFGDVARCRVATLGLNPSNREFVDDDGNELNGEARRFHTLRSFGIARWSEARRTHVRQIVESCRAYFTRNPYDSWFKQLDHIISGTRASYYDSSTSACHLDLIPFATACKWTGLTREQRSILLEVSTDALAELLRDSPVRVLVLNGRSVVDQFEDMAAVKLECHLMPHWSLRRGGEKKVAGYAYKGTVRTFAGLDMGRDILVLGFNHNIQSSFGVSNEVREAIRTWVGNADEEADS